MAARFHWRMRLRMLWLRVFQPERHAFLHAASRRLQDRLLSSPVVCYTYEDWSVEACLERVLRGAVCEVCKHHGIDERGVLECFHSDVYNVKTGHGWSVRIITWTPEWCPLERRV